MFNLHKFLSQLNFEHYSITCRLPWQTVAPTNFHKAFHRLHLFPQLYPHLNYGCATYCTGRQIKQTSEGTSPGDMWVSVESQAG